MSGLCYQSRSSPTCIVNSSGQTVAWPPWRIPHRASIQLLQQSLSFSEEGSSSRGSHGNTDQQLNSATGSRRAFLPGSTVVLNHCRRSPFECHPGSVECQDHGRLRLQPTSPSSLFLRYPCLRSRKIEQPLQPTVHSFLMKQYGVVLGRVSMVLLLRCNRVLLLAVVLPYPTANLAPQPDLQARR